ncbi:MAG: hypothetical protein H0V18_16460 [Pyrinomonadaceae bacterium]|jgi:septal ring factor EnvC (AmiA/AmiB activator)|nr:hypothetical protein [Pyrinomonadaceae bacterium]
MSATVETETIRTSRDNMVPLSSRLEEYKAERARQTKIAAELQQTLARIEAEVGKTYQAITDAPDDLGLLEQLSRDLRALKLKAAAVERDIGIAQAAAARAGQEFQRWTEQVTIWRWRRRQLVEMLATADDDGPATHHMMLRTDTTRNKATITAELKNIFGSLEGFK